MRLALGLALAAPLLPVLGGVAAGLPGTLAGGALGLAATGVGAYLLRQSLVEYRRFLEDLAAVLERNGLVSAEVRPPPARVRCPWIEAGLDRLVVVAARKQREAALAEQRARTLGHDLRTALRVVRNAAEVLADAVPGRTAEHLLREAQHALELGEELRVVGGPPNDLLLLSDAVTPEEVLGWAAAAAQSVGLAFEGAADPAVRGRRLRCAARYLRQAVRNLVWNAARHGRPQVRRVRVEVGPTGLLVEDDGPGLPRPPAASTAAFSRSISAPARAGRCARSTG